MGGTTVVTQNAGASDGSLGVSGSTGAFAKDGLALNNSTLALGGVSLGGSNTGQITINGGAGVQELAGQFTEALDDLVSSQSETTKQAADKSAQSSSDFSSLRTILIYAAAGIGLLLFASIFLRKKS